MSRRRRVGRVLVFDPEGRILLQHGHDPTDATKAAWWELPGGGCDGDEPTGDAGARECWEETGIRPHEVGPCVWRNQVDFTFYGWHFRNDEWIHVAWSQGGEYRPMHLEALEEAAFLGARWWDVDELLASDEPTLPVRLREFLPDVVAGRYPSEPIDISLVL